jgi:hypothetical protein
MRGHDGMIGGYSGTSRITKPCVTCVHGQLIVDSTNLKKKQRKSFNERWLGVEKQTTQIEKRYGGLARTNKDY